MTLDFRLPLINPHMAEAQIEVVYATAGAELKSGSKLLDLSVDLSSAFSQDCPPVSYFRIILREHATVREVRVEPGQVCKVGEVVAVFTTTPDEPLTEPAGRAVRLATAGIMYQAGMWRGRQT